MDGWLAVWMDISSADSIHVHVGKETWIYGCMDGWMDG